MRNPDNKSTTSEMHEESILHAWYALNRARHRVWQCIKKTCTQLDLRERELLILAACQRQAEGIDQSQIAGETGISAGQVSNVVEDLRKRELLVSYRPTSDRRKQHWQLTSDGERILNSVSESLAADSTSDALKESLGEEFCSVAKTTRSWNEPIQGSTCNELAGKQSREAA